MTGFKHVLPLALAAATSAFLVGVLEYASGSTYLPVIWIFLDHFSGVSPTSVLMVLWALSLALYGFAGKLRQGRTTGTILFLLPAVFGLGAVSAEVLNLLLGAQMMGHSASETPFRVFEVKLASALTFMTLTLTGMAGQTAIEICSKAKAH